MDEPHIGDRGWDQGLHGCHAEALHGARRRERGKGSGFSGPEAAHHQPDRCCEVDGSLADLNGERVAEKTGDCYGDDTGTLKADGEFRKREVELCCQGGQGRCQKRTDGYTLFMISECWLIEALCTPGLYRHLTQVLGEDTNLLHSRNRSLSLLYTSSSSTLANCRDHWENQTAGEREPLVRWDHASESVSRRLPRPRGQHHDGPAHSGGKSPERARAVDLQALREAFSTTIISYLSKLRLTGLERDFIDRMRGTREGKKDT